MVNLTPDDNGVPASQRTTPDQYRTFELALSGSAASYKQLPRDLKFAVLIASVACTAIVSYYDGTTDDPGNLLAGSTSLKIPLPAGQAVQVPQNYEFNRVWGVIDAGTGTAKIQIIPGKGLLNGLIAES